MSKDEEQGVLEIGTKATISWHDKEGKEIGAESCPRSIPSILEHLEHMEQTKASASTAEEVKVSLRVAEPGEDGQPQTAEIELTKGPLKDVIEDVRKRMLTPEEALLQFHLTVSKLMDLSQLKGAMVTAVFDDARATGFTVLSESTPVTESDIKVLGTAADAQAKDYKHKMREARNIVFPDDKGAIITPGDARHVVP
jgi:hypothetical protein